MTYSKSRGEGCCSVSFLKCVLLIFNLVFLLAGLAVLAVGIWTVFEKQLLLSLLANSTFAVTTYLLIGAGAVVVIVSIIGCCAISREDSCGLVTYTFLLLLIFLTEAVAGILAYVYADQVYNDLASNLNSTFVDNYTIDSDKTNAIDIMQQQFRCCGAVRFEDWRTSLWYRQGLAKNNTVPDSCCRTPSLSCGHRDHPSNIFYDGCIHRLVDVMKDRLLILGAVGLGICLVQVFGVVFSCCLYVKLRDYRDDPY